MMRNIKFIKLSVYVVYLGVSEKFGLTLSTVYAHKIYIYLLEYFQEFKRADCGATVYATSECHLSGHFHNFL